MVYYNIIYFRDFEQVLKWLKSKRRFIETVIGQLTERFNIEKVRARKMWYFTNRIARKILAHTICVLINKQRGNPPLQFELLLKPEMVGIAPSRQGIFCSHTEIPRLASNLIFYPPNPAFCSALKYNSLIIKGFYNFYPQKSLK